jgi:hypothetical protein
MLDPPWKIYDLSLWILILIHSMLMNSESSDSHHLTSQLFNINLFIIINFGSIRFLPGCTSRWHSLLGFKIFKQI